MKIAIADDEDRSRQILTSYIEKYCGTHEIPVSISTFPDGSDLMRIMKHHAFDLIFLDIEMANLNGMETADQIREIDEDVTLIFVTQMAQFAVHGYKVGAFDYLIKPVEYFSFELTFRKAIRRIQKNMMPTLTIQTPDEIHVLKVNDLLYVDVMGHYITYHTKSQEIRVKGSLADVIRQVPETLFFQCNRYCVVNVSKVTKIGKNTISIGETAIDISRARRQNAVKAVAAFMGGNL